MNLIFCLSVYNNYWITLEMEKDEFTRTLFFTKHKKGGRICLSQFWKDFPAEINV